MAKTLKSGIVAVDARGRVNLSKFGVKAGDLFLVRKEGETIYLEPAVIVPISELKKK